MVFGLPSPDFVVHGGTSFAHSGFAQARHIVVVLVLVVVECVYFLLFMGLNV